VKSRFDEKESQEFIAQSANIFPEFALRVYTSRLLGRDSSLVLHGGGNTSVKLRRKNLLGEDVEVIFVKGSGADLATIDPSGFVGLELEPLRKLQRLADLSEGEMENQLKIHKILHRSPDPSVEVLLHAFLPPRFIDHTHADSILTLTNQKRGEDLTKEILGPRVAVLPYLTPGIQLAKGVLAVYEKDPDLEGVVVARHGIFTFAEDGRTSYERMIRYVGQAEEAVEKKAHGGGFDSPRTDMTPPQDVPLKIARFCNAARGACAFSTPEGRLRRFYAEVRSEPEWSGASLLPEAQEFCESGVLTPDHVIRSKNRWAFLNGIPEDDADLFRTVRGNVKNYISSYQTYFSSQVQRKGIDREMLDPYPRVFLVAGIGLVALGFSRNEARMAADIAEHTLRAKIRAGAMGGYEPIDEGHVFDMEYWSLQQKKLGEKPFLPLQGQIALITGAGGAIGLGIADRLLAAGAAVVLSDIDEASLKKVHSVLLRKYEPSRMENLIFDVTDYEAVEKAFQEISRRIGGLDTVIPNAGIAHVARVESLESEAFERVMDVNLKGTFHTIKASIPIFRRQGTGGNIVVVSSKNVFDPGVAFGAYSASKAGAHQIAKIAALELAELGVRVNLVNPDAVFGNDEIPSKLWELVGPDRMRARGLDAQGLKEYYRQRNLLHVPVTAEEVGNAVVFFASGATPTTGATLPVDGGIPGAFPR
jgi:rhamnose utilization protein RhaD (predicted bifunctional aldolase and dehydrogenase)/NAD(P)-dependent dehydrogenase (short-subunit alcohol dehydrogenase family)